MITFESIRPHLIYQFKDEAELINAIKKISENFTLHRDKIQDYLNDPKLVAAYTVFFLSTNFPKLEAVLKWLPKDLVASFASYELIDVGAGPGTFSLAWKSFFPESAIQQIEASSLMREQAQKIMQGFYPQDKMQQHAHVVQSSERKKLLLFGHSLNEMGLVPGLEYVKRANPEVVMMIEPGTKAFFQEALKFRAEMMRLGFEIAYPCQGQGTCPLEKSEEDWCHQFIDVLHDPSIERICQMVHRDRRHMPVTVHVYTKAPQNKEDVLRARLIRIFPKTKFSYEWEACHEVGGKNLTVRLQLQNKHVEKADVKKIDAMKSGDEVIFTLEKETQDYLRIKLIKNT